MELSVVLVLPESLFLLFLRVNVTSAVKTKPVSSLITNLLVTTKFSAFDLGQGTLQDTLLSASDMVSPE